MDVSHFSVYSKGVGASSGRRMTLKRWGAQVLPEGTYPLEPIDLNFPSTTGVTVVYTTENDESYVLYDGQLEVTASSDERVEGRFDFEAYRYCPPICLVGEWVPPQAPRIRVRVSFVAVPRPPLDFP